MKISKCPGSARNDYNPFGDYGGLLVAPKPAISPDTTIQKKLEAWSKGISKSPRSVAAKSPTFTRRDESPTHRPKGCKKENDKTKEDSMCQFPREEKGLRAGIRETRCMRYHYRVSCPFSKIGQRDWQNGYEIPTNTR